METSGEFNKLVERYRVDKQSGSISNNDISDRCITSIHENDELNFIDLEAVDFDNEETWLYTCKETCSNSDATDIHQWLENNTSASVIQKPITPVVNFDTRTFTRPKKRLNLTHSIEKDFGIEASPTLEGGTTYQENCKPLQFDLTQPVRINTFDQILESAGDALLDSFQNMSPPSLCSNSMCSSTLTNLMENSYIKNDLDFESDSILVQSLTSEDQFEFLENNSSAKYNTYNKYSNPFLKSKGGDENDLNSTFALPIESKFNESNILGTTLVPTPKSVSNETNILSETNNSSIKPIERNILSDTFSTSLKSKSNEENFLSETYNTSVMHKNEGNVLSDTFNVSLKSNKSCKEENQMDTTFTVPLRENVNNKTQETPKILYSMQTFTRPDKNTTFSKQTGRNLNATFQKLSDSQPDLTTAHKMLANNKISNNRTIELNTNPNGSTDSLDERLSSFSDSSKDSPHIFNVEDWEAIAKSQELSLQQGISTPKPNAQKRNKIFNDDMERFISPIVKTTLSDSDISIASSVEECNNLHSGSSKTSSHGSLSNATILRGGNRCLQKPETFIKPLGTTERKTLVAQPNNLAGPRSIPIRAMRPSGLPRPASSISTGIPRPMSRIPGPKFARPSAPRSMIQRSNPGSKSNLNEKPY